MSDTEQEQGNDPLWPAEAFEQLWPRPEIEWHCDKLAGLLILTSSDYVYQVIAESTERFLLYVGAVKIRDWEGRSAFSTKDEALFVCELLQAGELIVDASAGRVYPAACSVRQVA
ncbi:MAG: hypothetical protein EOP18_11455 [Rhizobiaceae bacterium]|nr:MAG: hypothetical protein EOP18_11455 [Rhizobiaceae bacterium]